MPEVKRNYSYLYTPPPQGKAERHLGAIDRLAADLAYWREVFYEEQDPERWDQ